MKQLEIFGDSILRGVIYSEKKGKYGLSADCKYAQLEQYGVKVHNNCKMGATVQRGFSLLEKRLPSCDKDTTVLLEFGGNDCDYNWQEISENPGGSFLPFTPEKQFLETYAEAVSYARRQGATVAIASLAPISAPKYMNWISRGRSYDNILHWLGDVDHLARWQSYYNDLVEKLAASLSCKLFRLREVFLSTGRYDSLLCADGIHPTQTGHDLIVRSLKEFVQEV